MALTIVTVLPVPGLSVRRHYENKNIGQFYLRSKNDEGGRAWRQTDDGNHSLHLGFVLGNHCIV